MSTLSYLRVVDVDSMPRKASSNGHGLMIYLPIATIRRISDFNSALQKAVLGKLLAQKQVDAAAAKITADRLVAEQEANLKLDHSRSRAACQSTPFPASLLSSRPILWPGLSGSFWKVSPALTALSLCPVLLSKNINSRRTS